MFTSALARNNMPRPCLFLLSILWHLAHNMGMISTQSLLVSPYAVFYNLHLFFPLFLLFFLLTGSSTDAEAAAVFRLLSYLAEHLAIPHSPILSCGWLHRGLDSGFSDPTRPRSTVGCSTLDTVRSNAPVLYPCNT